MKIQIETDAAPDPVGAYSQAVRIGDTLQVSGQVGIDPHTESLVGGTVYAQTLQALRNVQAILTAAGADFEDVLMLRCSSMLPRIRRTQPGVCGLPPEALSGPHDPFRWAAAGAVGRDRRPCKAFCGQTVIVRIHRLDYGCHSLVVRSSGRAGTQ